MKPTPIKEHGLRTQEECYATRLWFSVRGFALGCLAFMNQMKRKESHKTIRLGI